MTELEQRPTFGPGVRATAVVAVPGAVIAMTVFVSIGFALEPGWFNPIFTAIGLVMVDVAAGLWALAAVALAVGLERGVGLITGAAVVLVLARSLGAVAAAGVGTLVLSSLFPDQLPALAISCFLAVLLIVVVPKLLAGRGKLL